MLLTPDQMKILADLERKMDSGEQPFVQTSHSRMAFRQELLDECGIKSGQSVSTAMVHTLMQMSLASLQVQIITDNMKKL